MICCCTEKNRGNVEFRFITLLFFSLKLVTPENSADNSENLNLHVSFADQQTNRTPPSASRLSFNSVSGGTSPRRGVKRRRLAEEEFSEYPTG
jgi:hypothetical protein